MPLRGKIRTRREVHDDETTEIQSEFKVRVVMELLTGEKGLGEASREYQIKDSVYFTNLRLKSLQGEFMQRFGKDKLVYRMRQNE